jgi:hypothetical protein
VKRGLKFLGIFVLLFLVVPLFIGVAHELLFGQGGLPAAQAYILLLVGWSMFLPVRLLKTTVNWSGVGMLVVCLGLTIAFAHSFCRWLWRGTGHAEPWRPRWTLTGVAVVVLMFVSGMAITGVAHQIGWLLHSPEPLVRALGPGPRIAKAQADTRSIASAISIYFAHCSGLPADSSRTDCPVAAEPGGPHPVPKSLFVQQTNARGQVGGPFLNARPRLPQGWTGAANSYSYAYSVLSDGKFLICAHGDSTGADSNGGAPTACP